MTQITISSRTGRKKIMTSTNDLALIRFANELDLGILY